MKSSIIRKVTIVTTTVQTVKTTTKDTESFDIKLDGKNPKTNDLRIDSKYDWETPKSFETESEEFEGNESGDPGADDGY